VITFFTRMNVICHKNKKQNNKLEILKLNFFFGPTLKIQFLIKKHVQKHKKYLF